MKKYATVVIILALVGACSVEKPEEKIVFEPTWESMKQFQVPDWFRDAKFGIYFHWGPYSVPAHETEWYSHWMYQPGHPIRKYHEETFGPLSEFGYKDFIPLFTAEKFDADAWVDLFVKAGARFAGPVTEHADGFAMWDSELTGVDAMDMGPKRDIVGEMAAAIRKTDMKFITTFHHQWLYAWYTTWDENTDTRDPQWKDLYGPIVPPTAWAMAREVIEPMPGPEFNARWHDRLIEVIDKYEPDLIYFDNKLDIIDTTYTLDFLSYYYNKGQEWGKDVMITYKFTDIPAWSGVLDLERARMSEKKEFPWLTDDSVDWGSWCNVSDPDYKSTNRLIDFLVDVVSKNGCVLLNITPTAQGEIPQPVQDRLLEIGQWLKINGEAIYDTRPWTLYGEGPAEVVDGHLSERQNKDNTAEDIRFTVNGKMLYAIVLDIPSEDRLTIRSLVEANGFDAGAVKGIRLLGSEEPVKWSAAETGLTLEFGSAAGGLEHAMAFAIELK